MPDPGAANLTPALAPIRPPNPPTVLTVEWSTSLGAISFMLSAGLLTALAVRAVRELSVRGTLVRPLLAPAGPPLTTILDQADPREHGTMLYAGSALAGVAYAVSGTLLGPAVCRMRACCALTTRN